MEDLQQTFTEMLVGGALIVPTTMECADNNHGGIIDQPSTENTTTKGRGTDYSKSLLGMKAEKWELIYEMFRKHSQAIGFSIRKATSRRANGSGTPVFDRYFVCSCAGVHGNGNRRDDNGNPLRNSAVTRCQCKAGLRTQVNEDGQWEVMQHFTEHNHDLIPPQWYNLICGAFVGINNHWSNVMFGCAFLSDEQEESFRWLFNVFNEAMGDDVRPVSIFTDQDKAMTNAVEAIYPESRHRLCQWHIQQNAISHFVHLKHDRTFQNLFNKCLNGCFNEKEFEATWQRMTTEYGVENHPWFNRLYSLRIKWCTALNNQYFSAGILSSQRSESTNHAMGFQASKTTSVTEFFGIFETSVRRWRREKERKEFNSIRASPTSAFPLVDLLQHASQIYTMELFRVFEKEFGLAMGTRAALITHEDTTLIYSVDTVGNEGSSHHVTYDCGNNLCACTCRKYQVMGIICYHIIRVLHMHSVQEIPASCIHRRWTKFAKTEVWKRLLPSDMRRSAANEAINWRRSTLTNVHNLITKSQKVMEARVIMEKFFEAANL
ncbi:protein FAR1-RELATED SEQUENCE 5-like [Silene latifolia]|uniref:protein FAR1-RELATED SEQUENCE 5-like n=1 Tax=Silene latifolia TaxID=37657 RepID=UPI003D776DA3